MNVNKLVCVLGLCFGLALIGCGGSPSPTPASATPTHDTAATAMPEPTEPQSNSADSVSNPSGNIALVERILPDPTTRAFRYAGADFVIQEASISNRDLTNRNRILPGNPWVNITIKATNDQDYPVTTPKFETTFADGTKVSGLDGIRLNKHDSTDLNLRGVVKSDTAWDGAILVLAENAKEPLKIPLTGAIEKSENPRVLKPGTAVTATNKYGEKIQVQVTDAQLNLDGIVSGQRAERAPAGKRFVHVNAQVQNTDAKNGISVGAEYLQLVADGTPAGLAFDETGAQMIPLNESVKLSLYFIVPANATELKIIVAPDGQEPKEITLTP